MPFFDRYSWIYKDSRGIPRDTHFPEVVIQSKTADYANAYNLWKVQRAYLEQPPAAVINGSKKQQREHLQEDLVAMENRSQKRSRRTTISNPVATTTLLQNNAKRNTTTLQEGIFQQEIKRLKQELQKHLVIGKKLEKDNQKLKTTNNKLAASQAPSKKTQQQKAASINLEEEDSNQKSRRGGSSKKQINTSSQQNDDTSLSVAIVDAVLQAMNKKDSSSGADDGNRELSDARQKQLQTIDQSINDYSKQAKEQLLANSKQHSDQMLSSQKLYEENQLNLKKAIDEANLELTRSSDAEDRNLAFSMKELELKKGEMELQHINRKFEDDLAQKQHARKMEKVKAKNSHALDLQKLNSSMAQSLAKLGNNEEEDD